jgi:hypothetical protein
MSSKARLNFQVVIASGHDTKTLEELPNYIAKDSPVVDMLQSYGENIMILDEYFFTDYHQFCQKYVTKIPYNNIASYNTAVFLSNIFMLDFLKLFLLAPIQEMRAILDSSDPGPGGTDGDRNFICRAIYGLGQFHSAKLAEMISHAIGFPYRLLKPPHLCPTFDYYWKSYRSIRRGYQMIQPVSHNPDTGTDLDTARPKGEYTQETLIFMAMLLAKRRNAARNKTTPQFILPGDSEEPWD